MNIVPEVSQVVHIQFCKHKPKSVVFPPILNDLEIVALRVMGRNSCFSKINAYLFAALTDSDQQAAIKYLDKKIKALTLLNKIYKQYS